MEETTQTAASPSDGFNLQMFLAAKRELTEEIDGLFDHLKAKPKFDRKDLVKLVTKLKEKVDNVDQLSDVVINDLMVVDQRLFNIEQRVLAVGQSHTVMRQALTDKAVVTEDDMRIAWEEKIKPQLEAKIKAAQEATAGLENLVQVPDKTLVDANGFPIT